MPSLVVLQLTVTPEIVAWVPTAWKAPRSPFQHCGALAAEELAGAADWLAQAESARAATEAISRERMIFSRLC